MNNTFDLWFLIVHVKTLPKFYFCPPVAGIRALLIRKDKNPKWDPSRIEDVTEEEILPLYEPLPNNEVVKLYDCHAFKQNSVKKTNYSDFHSFQKR